MKYLSLFLMTAIVSCLLPASTVKGQGVGSTDHDSFIPLFLLLLILFPLLGFGSATRNTDSTVVNVESDSVFYNRVVCATATNPGDCLTCFNLITQSACTNNLICAFNVRNNLCHPG